MNVLSKPTRIAAAVATALGASAAFAIPPTGISAIPTANYFWAGGGSAQANAAKAAFISLVTPASLDIYTTGGACTEGSYILVTGNLKSGLGSLLSGAPVVLEYIFTGGSYPNGGDPQVNPAHTRPFPVSGDGSGTAGNPHGGDLGNTATVAITCTGGVAAGVPDWNMPSPTLGENHTTSFGLTDVELQVFNVTDNLGSATAAPFSLNGVTQDGIYLDVFGIAVTPALYAVKTNFTKAEVTCVLQGHCTDWSQLLSDANTALADPAGQAGIWFLDRTSGSGTKASGSQYFLNYPGGSTTTAFNESTVTQPQSVTNANGLGLGTATFTPTAVSQGYTSKNPLVMPVAVNTTTKVVTCVGATAVGYQDVGEASTGTVVQDLQTAHTFLTPSQASSGYTVAAGCAAGGLYAMSIVVAEAPPALNQQVAGTNDYAFAKLGGVGIDSGWDSENNGGAVSPVTGLDHDNINTFRAQTALDPNGQHWGTSYSNVIKCAYDFAYQNSLNTASGFLNTTSNQVSFAKAAKAALQSASLAGANSGQVYPTSVAGILNDVDVVGGNPNTTPGTSLCTRSKKTPSSFLTIGNEAAAITWRIDPM